MSYLPRAALAAAVFLLVAGALARADEPLTLDDAFARVVETHPELEALRYGEAALAAERERAALPPPLALGAGAENVLGTGDASGFHGAELTLSLASVLERGGKRDARIAVADRRLEALALVRSAKRLDLLAEVARRYLDAASARALAELAREDAAQRARIVDAAAARVDAGGAPESTRLSAEAARLRA